MPSQYPNLDSAADQMRKEFKELSKKSEGLTKTERHYLDYFWSRRWRTLRKKLTRADIQFIEENPDEDTFANQKFALDLSKVFLEIQRKGYVEQHNVTRDEYYTLTNKGTEYFAHKYPSWKIRIEQLLDSTPLFIKIIVGAIGFIASVFGIIQFIDWIGFYKLIELGSSS